MHISGEEAAGINIAIGAALAWGGAAWNQWRIGRQASADARSDRRRDAYAALILAFDHLNRAWTAGETLESEHLSQNMGEITGGAMREIQQAHVAVLLTGSAEAKRTAKAARNAAWDLNDRLRGRVDRVDAEKLFDLFDAFTLAAKEFVQVAERELG